MKLKDLQFHLLRLAALKEEADPVISCYLNPEPGGAVTLEERLRVLRTSVPDAVRDSLDEALQEVRSFVASDLSPKEGGIAVFARGGSAPFFLGLRLKAPLPDSASADWRPRIYPLVEIRDNYDHYVVMHATDRKVTILEVDLGAATEEVVLTRPGLRRREGREWTKDRFQSHRQERTRVFIKDGVKTLASVMSAGWYRRFILTGEPRAVAEVKKSLPRSLEAMLLDTVPFAGGDSPSELVAATISCFRVHEERESRTMVDRLEREIGTSGHGVSGSAACWNAVKRGQVDTVVMAQQYNPGLGWECPQCGLLETAWRETARCPGCGRRLAVIDLKEEIIRAAVLNGCEIEIVANSQELLRMGGVGCLLRYLAPEQRIAWMSA